MPPRSLMLIELSLRDMQKASASVERAISRVAMAEVVVVGFGSLARGFFSCKRLIIRRRPLRSVVVGFILLGRAAA